MSRPRLASLAVIVAVALLLAAGFNRRHALACELLPLAGYRPLQADVFAGHSVDGDQARHLQALVAAASDRIATLYGPPVSRPRIVFAGTAGAARRLGANDTASMHRSPWRSCIVIGPDGRNVDVIAHEWLHAEIQHRVGFWRSLREVPVWFDEGAALTVDHRAPFLPENLRLDPTRVAAVRQRASGRAFFSGDTHAHYQAARLAVVPLIRPAQFHADLARIAAGESFEDVFGSRVPAD